MKQGDDHQLGDETALAALFQQHRHKLRSMVAFRMDSNLKGRVDPSDVIQESFLDLSKRLNEFNERKAMSPFVWMRLVTLESLVNVHRRHITTQQRDARRDLSIDRDVGLGVTSVSLAAGLLAKLSSASGKAVRSEQKARLHELINQLDDDDREIIGLRFFEGVSNGEAAEILGLTKQTASKRFMRAIERLRTSMHEVPGLAELFGNG